MPIHAYPLDKDRSILRELTGIQWKMAVRYRVKRVYLKIS